MRKPLVVNKTNEKPLENEEVYSIDNKFAPEALKHWGFSSIDSKSIQKINQGFINSSYYVRVIKNGKEIPVFLQLINEKVFPHPELIIKNSILVMDSLTKQYLKEGFTQNEVNRRVLRLIFPTDKHSHVLIKTADGDKHWRLYHYIEDTYTKDVAIGYSDSYELGKALAEFNQRLNRIQTKFHNSFPGYEDSDNYLSKYGKNKLANPVNRLDTNDEVYQWVEKNGKSALDFLKSHENDANFFTEIRKTHTDPKGNNILLDKDTNEPLAIVDWDTLLETLPIHVEWGYAVKFLCSTTDESDSNEENIDFNLDSFIGFANGWLDHIGYNKNDGKEESVAILHNAILHIIWQQGLRFYSDYINDDKYFRIDETSPKNANYIRAWNQMILWKKAKSKSEDIERILKTCFYR